MKIINKFKKSEKGSITVMVLTSMLFMLVVITASYLSISNKSVGQNRKITQISKQYQVTEDDIKEEYNKVYNSIDFTSGLGDIDQDEDIDQEDVNLLSEYLEETYEFNDEQKLRADINKDEQITQEDVTDLEEYIEAKVNNLESTET